MNENCDVEILERIQNKYKEHECEEKETSECERITTQDAGKFKDQLCYFFEKDGNEGCSMSSIDVMDN